MHLPTVRRATRISLPLLGAFVVGAIAYGGLYTFPALSVAFAQEFGISRTLAVTPWTMFLLVTAIASPLLGRAYDEWADRDLLTASMVLLAGGWLTVYLAPDIAIVILAYAAFHALGLQLAFIGISTAVARRYAGVSGLALGVAYAGPGIGVAIALPFAARLIRDRRLAHRFAGVPRRLAHRRGVRLAPDERAPHRDPVAGNAGHRVRPGGPSCRPPRDLGAGSRLGRFRAVAGRQRPTPPEHPPNRADKALLGLLRRRCRHRGLRRGA